MKRFYQESQKTKAKTRERLYLYNCCSGAYSFRFRFWFQKIVLNRCVVLAISCAIDFSRGLFRFLILLLTFFSRFHGDFHGFLRKACFQITFLACLEFGIFTTLNSTYCGIWIADRFFTFPVLRILFLFDRDSGFHIWTNLRLSLNSRHWTVRITGYVVISEFPFSLVDRSFYWNLDLIWLQYMQLNCGILESLDVLLFHFTPFHILLGSFEFLLGNLMSTLYLTRKMSRSLVLCLMLIYINGLTIGS